MRSARTVSASVLLLTLAADVGSAQDSPRPVFDDTVSVVEVEVPIQVVRAGEPVRGLTADNFVVLDEGQRRGITSFRVVDLAEVGAEEAEEEVEPLDPLARRHFLFLFDFAFTEAPQLVRAESAAREMIENLHPTDLVALAFFSGRRGSSVVLNFTSDHRQALRVLDGLAYLLGSRDDPGSAAEAPARRDALKMVAGDWRFVLGELGAMAGLDRGEAGEMLTALSGVGGNSFEGFLERNILNHMATVEQASLDERRARAVAGLSDSLRALVSLASGVEGRKYLMLLSQGFDGMLPGAESRNFYQVGMGVDGGGWLIGELRETVESFRREGWVLNTVALGGVTTHRDSREGLFYLSNETGGVLVERTNDLAEGLREILRSTSVTYVLTFAAPRIPSDDPYRRLQVKLTGVRGNARVSHRAAYRSSPLPLHEDAEAGRLAVADLLAGRSVAREDGLGLMAMPLGGVAEVGRVALMLEIPSEDLAARQADGSVGLEIYIYAFDATGRIHGHLERFVTLNRERAEVASARSGLKYFDQLQLPAGRYEIRCAVRNLGDTAVRTDLAEVAVPAREMAGRQLLVPVLLQPEGERWMVLVGGQADSAGPSYPFSFQGLTAIPAARSVLSPGQDVRLLLVGHGVERVGSSVFGRIEGAGMPSREVLLSLETHFPGLAQGGPEAVLASFELLDLPVGEYSLQLPSEQGEGPGPSVPFRVGHH